MTQLQLILKQPQISDEQWIFICRNRVYEIRSHKEDLDDIHWLYLLDLIISNSTENSEGVFNIKHHPLLPTSVCDILFSRSPRNSWTEAFIFYRLSHISRF